MGEVEQLSAGQAAERRRVTPDAVVLLDVREAFELDRARIVGALHIPMGEVSARAAGLDPSKQLIVFCHSGIRSMNVAADLSARGFERVANMTGGIDAWSRTVDPAVPRY